MEKTVNRLHKCPLLIFALTLMITSLNLFAQTSENQFTVKTEVVEQNEQKTNALNVIEKESAETESANEETTVEADAAEMNETTVPEKLDNLLGIAEEHLPPPGDCLVWYMDRPVEQQPEVRRNCERVQKRMPKGAILLYRPLVNSQYVEVCHFDDTNRGVVKMVRFYMAATGELQREEKF